MPTCNKTLALSGRGEGRDAVGANFKFADHTADHTRPGSILHRDARGVRDSGSVSDAQSRSAPPRRVYLRADLPRRRLQHWRLAARLRLPQVRVRCGVATHPPHTLHTPSTHPHIGDSLHAFASRRSATAPHPHPNQRLGSMPHPHHERPLTLYSVSRLYLSLSFCVVTAACNHLSPHPSHLSPHPSHLSPLQARGTAARDAQGCRRRRLPGRW